MSFKAFIRKLYKTKAITKMIRILSEHGVIYISVHRWEDFRGHFSFVKCYDIEGQHCYTIPGSDWIDEADPPFTFSNEADMCQLFNDLFERHRLGLSFKNNTSLK